MSLFHKSTEKRSAAAAKRRTAAQAHLQIESLEERSLMAVSPAGSCIPCNVPDYAGSDIAHARAVNLLSDTRQTLSDNLPFSSDKDVYQVYLRKGDFLAMDIDPKTSTPVNSTLRLLNGAGGQIAVASTGRSTVDPDTGIASRDSVLGYRNTGADAYFYIEAGTTDTAASATRAYDIHLHRVGLAEGNISAAALSNEQAPFHAWLKESSAANQDILHVAGPTGYGFSIRGNWTKQSVAASAATHGLPGMKYTTTGTVYLKMATGQEIALTTTSKENFSVTTEGRVWLNEFGKVSSFSGKLGLSSAMIDTLAAKIEEKYGLDLSLKQAILPNWTIKTGSEIKQQLGVQQVLDGAPYLVFSGLTSLHLDFGKINVDTKDLVEVTIVIDPSDPMFYVNVLGYAFGGSFQGRIPFDALVPVPTGQQSLSALDLTTGPDLFGHVYAKGSYTPIGIPFLKYAELGLEIEGEMVLNLDANRDGQYLAGQGNADKFMSGDFENMAEAMAAIGKDMSIGLNGEVHVTCSIPVGQYDNVNNHTPNVPVPIPEVVLGQGSLIYNGADQSVGFAGQSGNLTNFFEGTVLEPFHSGQVSTLKGYAHKDGRWMLSAGSEYFVAGMKADLTITLNQDEIKVAGTARALGAQVSLIGVVQYDGDFSLTGSASISYGNDNGRFSGSASFVLNNNIFTAAVNLQASAQWKDAVGTTYKISGRVSGNLKISNVNGSLKYSGNVWLENVKGTIGGEQVFSASDFGVTISNNKITFDAGKMGSVSIKF